MDNLALARPAVIEYLDFEQILNTYKNAFLDLQPSSERAKFAQSLEIESSPILKIMQAAAYRELVLRARINDAANSCMIAFATGSDLDALAANFGVVRLLIEPANNNSNPPTAAKYENDEELRVRALRAFSSLSVAGPGRSYEFYALQAAGNILDVKALSPAPAVVQIVVLTRDNKGLADDLTLAKVEKALNADNVRPIGDRVLVETADIVNYQIKANIYCQGSKHSIKNKALANLQHLTTATFKLGKNLATSAIIAALHIDEVEKVELITPTADINVAANQALYCDVIDINLINVIE